MSLYEFEGNRPTIDPTAWIAPSADIIGDVRIGPKCYIGWAAVLRGDHGSIVIEEGSAIEEGVIIHTGPEGLEIICGACGLEGLADISEFSRQRLLKELTTLSFENDTIVIDTAAGISKSVMGFCLSSDHVLVVATPEAPAMTDAYAMIKVLVRNNFGGRISLIVNMSETPSEGKKVYQQIANVAKRFLNTHVITTVIYLNSYQ